MGAFKTYITGAKYHKGAETGISLLEEGETVYLIRDPSNQYDNNAVRVQSSSGQMLGHIPMDISQLVSDFILLDICTAEAKCLSAGKAKVEIAYDLSIDVGDTLSDSILDDPDLTSGEKD